MRLDMALKEWGLAPSRTKAQELIAAGQVEVCVKGQWHKADSASQTVDPLARDLVRLVGAEVLRYVSRGGLKLQAAADRLALKLAGLRALDVGISTGGFTDFLLQSGVAEVVGVDVGHGQLADRLRGDPRLHHYEGVNARNLSTYSELSPFLAHGFDLAVVDVSFISLKLVLSEVAKLLRPEGYLLALVKPQFEVGPGGLGKGGIVVDESQFSIVRAQIELATLDSGLLLKEYFVCPIKGQDGNQEFFLYAQKPN